MSDLLVLAFQTDTTRICTLKLNNDHGTLRFPHLGVDYMIHHLLSHSDTADWLKVNQFFLDKWHISPGGSTAFRKASAPRSTIRCSCSVPAC